MLHEEQEDKEQLLTQLMQSTNALLRTTNALCARSGEQYRLAPSKPWAPPMELAL